MTRRADDRVQRILIGIGLLAMGLFILLSLIPIGVLGAASNTFPSGNIVGPVGEFLSSGALGALGISAALVPVLPILWGVWSLGILDDRETVRWSGLLSASLLLLPPLLASLSEPAGGAPLWLAGEFGRWAGSTLGSAISWLGSSLVLLLALVALTVGLAGLGPLRALRGGARRVGAAGEAVGRWMEALSFHARRAAAWLLERFAGVSDRFSRPPPEGMLAQLGSQGGLAQESAMPAEPAARKRARRRESRAVQGELFARAEAGVPPLELLEPPPRQNFQVSEEALDQLGETLVRTLRTFKVEGSIAGRTTGPVVTQFEVVPASGVKVGKIASLSDDLALGLKAESLRIIAPIPGKGAVGVEVPNPRRKVVYLREILESDPYANSHSELPVALGEDVSGRSYIADLTQMPHLLIAGVTGSGKSVCINAIISSLIYRHTPERLRLLLIDPKMVELGGYNVLPHLRHPVVTDNNDAATVLKWLVYEMERRYEWLSANGCRNLREYNRRVARGATMRAPRSYGGDEVPDPETLPYIVLIVDELADLMMTVQAEVERPLAYLAQKARATGIHLVVATQRPSVNVITGLIKANFPCRIAFRVASKVDSRTIIDQNGAETLLGNGDMLFMPPGQAEPVRIQGTYVSTEDTERLMEWYREQAEMAERAAAGEEDILEEVAVREMEEAEAELSDEAVLEERDALFRRAAEVVVQHRQGSTSLLQRRLKIGYGRAARIVDQLEHAGVVGPSEGSKPREVLVTLQDLDRICASSES